MTDYLQTLEQEFEAHSNPQIAEGQKAYMRNQFEFYGLTSPKRKEIQRPFLVQSYLPPKEKLHALVKILWPKTATGVSILCPGIGF
ncbi:DNA alkylation repair protein [Maribacter aquimaris]|uniref:DNA alkylation repair protein n=1 Tax=Maribacter aquimaris TaxID=2737171 RepID=UPI0021D28CFF|nr:DNA alkylation repair protein [Maribacter aquimaris]